MKTNAWKKVTGCAALALGLALGTGGAALASTNILSGNVCQALAPPETTDGQGISHGYTGTKNLAANKSIRYVMCPVLRDNTSNTTGLTKLVVRTTVDSGFSGKTQCLGLVMTMYGSIKVSSWQTASSATGSSPMTWTNLTQSDNGSGAYDIQCALVYGGTINSIEYQEP
jgi:hypothetical protein